MAAINEDLFDRLLIAPAMVEGMALVTTDTLLANCTAEVLPADWQESILEQAWQGSLPKLSKVFAQALPNSDLEVYIRWLPSNRRHGCRRLSE